MKKILAFAGSNHSKSINHQLIEFTASLVSDVEVNILDIRNWAIPIYSIDMDPDQTPEPITELITLIKNSDGFIMSSPEHNGGTSAFLKNILDWLSRRSKKVFDSKPFLLMSTSPGAGGAAKHLKFLIRTLPYQGAEIITTFSLPSFQSNMEGGKLADDYLEQLNACIGQLKEKL